MIRFYSPDILSTGFLREDDSAHCCRVLRMKAGDEIRVVDGKGKEYMCEILDPNPRRTQVSIVSVTEEDRHWKPRISLAVAPTKNFDRMEWLLEKAVEIGVDKVTFLDCAHNVRRVIKPERVERIMVSAMKQSLKSRLPEFGGIVAMQEFVKAEDSAAKFMGYCSPEIERLEFARNYDGVSDLCILIGPEGDFSADEVEDAMRNGFLPVTFGNTRLRTETAALYALCCAHTLITLA